MRDETNSPLWPYRWWVRGCSLVAGLCAATAIGCAIYVKRAADNMPDVGPEENILAEGGMVQRDTVTPLLTVIADRWTNTYGPVIFVNYRGAVTRAKLEPVTRLTDPQELGLLDATGSDPGAWRLLAQLRTLRKFTAISCDIRDEDLVHLDGLPQLQRVDLWKCPNLTPAGVDRLRQARPEIHVNFP